MSNYVAVLRRQPGVMTDEEDNSGVRTITASTKDFKPVWVVGFYDPRGIFVHAPHAVGKEIFVYSNTDEEIKGDKMPFAVKPELFNTNGKNYLSFDPGFQDHKEAIALVNELNGGKSQA